MAADDKDDDEKSDAPPPGKRAGAPSSQSGKPGAVVDAEFEDEVSEGDSLAVRPERPLAQIEGGEGGEGVEGYRGGGDDEVEEAILPGQMGHRRYVYAVFFVFAICIAYFVSKLGLAVWHRLSQYTSKVGEPREDLVTPVAALLSGALVWFAYRKPQVRNLSDEVALELSKVEWPTREKVRQNTTIVVMASLGASLAFFLYDQIANTGVTFVTASKHPILYGMAGGVVVYVIRALGSRYLGGTERS